MKVPGSDGLDGKKTLVNDQASVRRPAVKEEVAPGLQAALAADQKQGDSIKVSPLGALLQSELNPSKMTEDRAKKVAALKAMIDNKSYAPDMQAVANSFSEELFFEISLAGENQDKKIA